MKSILLVLSMLGFSVAAETIDVVIVVDPAVSVSREDIDRAIDGGIEISNRVLALGGIDVERQVIDVVMAQTPVSAAALVSGPRSTQAAKEYIEGLTGAQASLFANADNVVFVVPAMGGGNIGNAGWDRYAVIQWSGDNETPWLFAHEVGHLDGIGDRDHEAAREHFDATGECTLMYPSSCGEVVDSLITDAEVVSLQDSAANATAGYLVMWTMAPAAEVPVVSARVVESAVDLQEGGEATMTVALDAPAEVDVSVEVFTRGVTATVGADYSADLIRRVTIPAGETEAVFTVDAINDADNEGAETYAVGIQYGRGTQTEPASAVVTIAASDAGNSGGSSNGGSGGGGSFGLLSLLGLALLRFRWR